MGKCFSGKQDRSLANGGTQSPWLMFWRRVRRLTLWQEPGAVVPALTENTSKTEPQKPLLHRHHHGPSELFCVAWWPPRNFPSPLNSTWTHSAFFHLGFRPSVVSTTRYLVWCYWQRHIIWLVLNLCISFKQRHGTSNNMRNIASVLLPWWTNSSSSTPSRNVEP